MELTRAEAMSIVRELVIDAGVRGHISAVTRCRIDANAVLAAINKPETHEQLNPQNMPCNCQISLPPRNRCTKQVLRCFKSIDFANRHGLIT